MTRGFFVSFMSGNSTRFAVSLLHDPATAVGVGGLIAAFMLGVMAGAVLRRVGLPVPTAAILALLSTALAAAAVLAGRGLVVPATLGLAFAMATENTIFAETGEVRVGLTYMTGALVKCAKGVVAAFFGEARPGWAPHLLLWLSLVSGATLGAAAFAHWGAASLWAPALSAAVMTTLSLRGFPPPAGQEGAA